MSMGSWYIIITKVYEQAKMNKAAQGRGEVVLERAVRARRAPKA